MSRVDTQSTRKDDERRIKALKMWIWEKLAKVSLEGRLKKFGDVKESRQCQQRYEKKIDEQAWTLHDKRTIYEKRGEGRNRVKLKGRHTVTKKSSVDLLTYRRPTHHDDTYYRGSFLGYFLKLFYKKITTIIRLQQLNQNNRTFIVLFQTGTNNHEFIALTF